MKILKASILLIAILIIQLPAIAQSQDTLQRIITATHSDTRTIYPDYSAFDQKGLLHASRFELKKHIGKTLKTFGTITHAAIVDSNAILYAGVDSAHTDFLIIIRPKDRSNFEYPQKFYLQKKVEVIEKVERYNGLPAFYLTRENQMRIIVVGEYR